MAAEVCLLLVQSLTGDCQVHSPNASASQIEHSQRDQISGNVTATETRVGKRIKPTTSPAEPQFAKLCEGDRAQQLAVCLLPSQAQKSWTIPQSVRSPAVTREPDIPNATSNTALVPDSDATPTTNLTTPVALNIPAPRRIVEPGSLAQMPQFSAPAEVASGPAVAVPQRPTTGTELFRQRQLALQSGQSYLRLDPDAFAAHWRQATQQPTYEDWKGLLAQEARAIAGGQGQNRLDVIVGDSFGMWLPPEMLPRDRLWLNQSISGDTTAGIMQRVSAFANTRPTRIHLMAGTNDLKTGVPEDQIISNLRQIVQTLRQRHPRAQIVIYSVLPTRRADIANDRVRSLNARLNILTQQANVDYRNMHSWFQDEWGHLRRDLTTDGLHLNSQGYALWQRAMLARAQ